MPHISGPTFATGLKELAPDFSAFIFDQWGVLHDGQQVYPGVLEVLGELRGAGKPVIVLTNSSKSSAINKQRLVERFGIQRSDYTQLVSSAEVMMRELQDRADWPPSRRGSRAYVVADGTDGGIVAGSGICPVPSASEADLVLLLSVDPREPIESHRSWISIAAERRLPLVCPSADRLTVTTAGVYIGMSAVVSAYRSHGGLVYNVGKPEQLVYDRCLALLEGLEPRRILAVGDQIWSDVAGAERAGMVSALVLTGAAMADCSGPIRPERLRDYLLLLAADAGVTPTWVLPELRW